MEILTFTTQQHWTTWFAVYLFLGGMGAAVVAVSFLTHMYLREEKELVMWGAISGVVMMVVGSGMLFLHLLNKWAIFYIVAIVTLIAIMRSKAIKFRIPLTPA
ncbi:MAG: polysulfide reductase NrfD, partial [Magnetococcales bacterium]|nr:polysulfide reductase NrfD [Magnetococcales bacterium]